VTQKTPQEEASEIGQTSGNSFHCRVINYFRERGWKTAISPFYVDGVTDKTRETDLIAEKLFLGSRDWRKEKNLRMRLFIECKYVAEKTTVFWFDAQDEKATRTWLNRHTPLNDGNQYQNEHHYLKRRGAVAKLFQTGIKAAEQEAIFKALNQTLHGYISNRMHPPLTDAGKWPTFGIDYPVIVFSDFSRFFRAEVSGAPEIAPIEENFLMEVNYAYMDGAAKKPHDYFLVDFVRFDRLDAFLKELENEVAPAQYLAGDVR